MKIIHIILIIKKKIKSIDTHKKNKNCEIKIHNVHKNEKTHGNNFNILRRVRIEGWYR